jgi:hypothetical protein
MLPGFRFLFAAIVLSMSVLVFGLGATALLRAAHEEFISSPSWRGIPETVFAQQAPSTKPMLALLTTEQPAPPMASDRAPAATATEPVTTPVPIAPETAMTSPENVSAAETAKPEVPPADVPAPSELPASTDSSAAAVATTIAAIDPAMRATSDAKLAATEPASPSFTLEKSAASEKSEPVAATDALSVPAAPSTAAAAGAAPAVDTVVAKLATLGDAAVASQRPKTEIESKSESESKSERLRRVAATKRLQARAAERRKIAQRARTPAPAATPAIEPFRGPYMAPFGGG